MKKLFKTFFYAAAASMLLFACEVDGGNEDGSDSGNGNGNSDGGGNVPNQGFVIKAASIAELPDDASKVIAILLDGSEKLNVVADAKIINGGFVLELRDIDPADLYKISEEFEGEDVTVSDQDAMTASLYLYVVDTSGEIIGRASLENIVKDGDGESIADESVDFVYCDRPCKITGSFTDSDDVDEVDAPKKLAKRAVKTL